MISGLPMPEFSSKSDERWPVLMMIPLRALSTLPSPDSTTTTLVALPNARKAQGVTSERGGLSRSTQGHISVQTKDEGLV